MPRIIQDDDVHYDGNCSILDFAMQLSGWTFAEFEIDQLPECYVHNDDFGPRVAKQDWMELLNNFPLWEGFLAFALVPALSGLIWFCCRIKGLHGIEGSKHRLYRCLVTFLLILLLLPLVAGLYLSSRANHLLRKYNGEQQRKRNADTAKFLDPKILDGYRFAEEFQNNTLQDDYENSVEELINELDKSIASEVDKFQKTLKQNEQTNFKQLKYLYTNRVFYKNALKTLREIAYELLVLGIEIDDFLRDFIRVGFSFLQKNRTFDSEHESNMFQPVKRLNVWHLSELYFHYIYSYESLEYLMEAYLNITKMHGSVAKIKPKPVEIENLQLAAPITERILNHYRSDSGTQEKRTINKSILIAALVMVFVTAALIYILFMALAFSIFSYYEGANFLIKCIRKIFTGGTVLFHIGVGAILPMIALQEKIFRRVAYLLLLLPVHYIMLYTTIFIFLSCLSIILLAVLAVFHFLLTMVLHTGICHEVNFYRRASARSASIDPLECAPYINSNQINFPAAEFGKRFVTMTKREIPEENIFHHNITDDQSSIGDSLQEKWYEDDMQALLATIDRVPYIVNVKQHYVPGTSEADIFLCKFNSIENIVKRELYAKEFVPNATLLYKTAININDRARSTSSKSFTKLLEDALNEVYIFDKLYTRTRNNYINKLDIKVNVELRKFNSIFATKSKACMHDYKCGCLEDWLMIYALGAVIIVLSLFFSMILSMLLYKINKRGPPVNIAAGTSSGTPVEACVPSVPPADTNTPAYSEGQASYPPGKDCVVDIKGDIVAQ